jgi:hypothetical protein
MKTYTDVYYRDLSIRERYNNWRYYLKKRQNAAKYNRKIESLYRELHCIDVDLQDLQQLKSTTISKISFMQSSLTVHKIGD